MTKVNLKATPYNLDDEQISWVERTLGSLTDEEKNWTTLF